jgi:hypothetical protein
MENMTFIRGDVLEIKVITKDGTQTRTQFQLKAD